jgi:hypothetical protein
MSYYDGNHTKNPVVFRYGVSSGSLTSSATSGDTFLTNGIGYNLSGTSQDSSSGAKRQVVADSTTSHKGGLYTAVGSLSTGRAVIAWYDATAKRLIFSYSQTANPNSLTTNNWQSNAKVIDENIGAGWHVDLTVDGADGIHIAYYDSDSTDLKYAYLSAYNATPTVVTVDSFLSTGTKLMINTRKEGNVYVPYISYYQPSFIQTSNSVRVAWKNVGAATGAVQDGVTDDLYTGAWEVMTVPTANVPIEDFVCNGAPATGVTTGTGFSGVNLTNTVLVTYMTDKYYERAYIKK